MKSNWLKELEESINENIKDTPKIDIKLTYEHHLENLIQIVKSVPKENQNQLTKYLINEVKLLSK